jgi:hypothetical protein
MPNPLSQTTWELQWENLRKIQTFDFVLEQVKCGANAKIIIYNILLSCFWFWWSAWKNVAELVSDAAPLMLGWKPGAAKLYFFSTFTNPLITSLSVTGLHVVSVMLQMILQHIII